MGMTFDEIEVEGNKLRVDVDKRYKSKGFDKKGMYDRTRENIKVLGESGKVFDGDE